ncbi:hypothetical protein Tco_0454989 [Tanacetum coccineum]
MEESSSKGPGDKIQQESTKKQKMDDDQERVELQSLMNVVPDEEEGRIVGIKRLLNDLRVTTVKLMLLVYKSLLLVFRVNAAGTKVTTAKRLQLLKG